VSRSWPWPTASPRSSSSTTPPATSADPRRPVSACLAVERGALAPSPHSRRRISEHAGGALCRQTRNRGREAHHLGSIVVAHPWSRLVA
jgi:hypothetical protein